MKIQAIATQIKVMKPGVPYQVKDTCALDVTEATATPDMHAARLTIAAWRDALIRKQRMNKRGSCRPVFPTAHRARMIELLADLYDSLAAVLVIRSAL